MFLNKFNPIVFSLLENVYSNIHFPTSSKERTVTVLLFVLFVSLVLLSYQTGESLWIRTVTDLGHPTLQGQSKSHLTLLLYKVKG